MVKTKTLKENLFEYRSGLPGRTENSKFTLDIENRDILVHEVKIKVLGKDQILQTYRIPLENIISLKIETEKELREGSVLGSSLVGGLLFGSTGAIVGGISGAGPKAKTAYLLPIVYVTPNAPEEPKVLLFDAENSYWLGPNTKAVKQIQKELDTVQPSALARQHMVTVERNEDGSITL